jgi:hypothetical protein
VEECRLAAALQSTIEALPEEASSSAAKEVADLLRRLGHATETPPDGATDERDDRVQEQRPG